MIDKKYFCDCCCREVVNRKEFYRIKVKSEAFINYANFDSFGADKRTFDICKNCIEDFKKYIKEIRSL